VIPAAGALEQQKLKNILRTLYFSQFEFLRWMGICDGPSQNRAIKLWPLKIDI
jgi:hypothetical protein